MKYVYTYTQHCMFSIFAFKGKAVALAINFFVSIGIYMDEGGVRSRRGLVGSVLAY